MTERAVTLVRQSQGDEDSISLEVQREETERVASGLADEVERIDLGAHTGFSVHMKGADETERIDTHPDIVGLLEDLRAGEYEYLVAYDDTRIARDQFYWEVKRAAILGDCEIRFVSDVPDDELTFRVQRAVESQVKMNEIQKSVEAWEKRDQEGAKHGPPPYGLEYDDDGRLWVPSDGFGDVLKAIVLRLEGSSWREVASATPLSRSTARRSFDRASEIVAAGRRLEGELSESVIEDLDVVEARVVGEVTVD